MTDSSGARPAAISASRIILVITLAACLCLAMLALLQSLGDLQLRQLVMGSWSVPALALHLSALALFVLAWQQLLAGPAPRQFQYRECLAHIGITLTGKYLPGKIWGLLGRSYLLTRRGLSRGSALHLLVADQFLTFYSGTVIMGIAGLLIVYPLAALPAVIAVAALSPWLLGSYRRLSGWLGRLAQLRQSAGDPSADQGQRNAGDNAEPPTSDALQPTTLLRVALIYSLHWVGLALALALLFYPALTEEFWLNLLLLVIAVPAGMLSGFLAIWAPGGIGVREAVMISILSINTSLELAAAIAIVYRLLCIGNDLLTGLFALHFFSRQDPGLLRPPAGASDQEAP